MAPCKSPPHKAPGPISPEIVVSFSFKKGPHGLQHRQALRMKDSIHGVVGSGRAEARTLPTLGFGHTIQPKARDVGLSLVGFALLRDLNPTTCSAKSYV